MPLSSEREEDLEEERDIDVELLTDVADDLSEDELLTEDEFLSDDDELLTAEPELERRLPSCELLVEADEEFLDDDDELPEDEELLEDEDERVCDDVVLLLEPVERLSCEYESTGTASMANVIADASAKLRKFFMTISVKWLIIEPILSGKLLESLDIL